MVMVVRQMKWEVHKMYKQLEDESSKPASEAELAKHNKPTIVKIPSNASKVANRLDSAKATGTTSVGDATISASKSVVKGVKTFTSEISNAAGRVQSGIAQAQSIAQDPVSYVVGLAEQATGFSVPSSPQGIVELLSKFSKPKVSGDGRTDLSKNKSAGENVVGEIGDVASFSADELSSKISSVSNAISSATEVVGAVTEISNLGGVPVDNVITQSISKISTPVQSTLTKVKNTTDGTKGIIT